MFVSMPSLKLTLTDIFQNELSTLQPFIFHLSPFHLPSFPALQLPALPRVPLLEAGEHTWPTDICLSHASRSKLFLIEAFHF